MESATELDGRRNWNMVVRSYLEIDIIIGIGGVADKKERG